MSNFTRDYYEDGRAKGLSCYENYRWMPEMTIPMCEAITKTIHLSKDETILDFGCAKGYVVRALRELGFKAHGVDISEYAINCSDPETKPFLTLLPEQGDFELQPFDWILCKDVLEHLAEEQCHELLRKFKKTGARLFVIVPLGDGKSYTIPEMELDVTHKVRRSLRWWAESIGEAGFAVSALHFSVPGIKENWTKAHPFGHGFIVT